MEPKPRYVLGLDLGQAADYTALCVLEAHPTEDRPVLHVRHLDRWRGISYVDIVARVARGTMTLPENTTLVVDATGVGLAVVDLFRRARLRCALVPVSIHGGDKVARDQYGYRVPKRDLVGTVSVLLESGRLKVAAALIHAATLTAELRNFRVTINSATSHDSYAAWREADHDDLVLSVALAAWHADHFGGAGDDRRGACGPASCYGSPGGGGYEELP